MGYDSMSLPPVDLRAHSTHGVATSWVLFQAASGKNVCAAASWATPHTLTKFYKLDFTAPTLSHIVLSVGSVPDVPVWLTAE